MSEREETLIIFIDQKILEYEIEHLECFANNNIDRAPMITTNIYTLSTLRELLEVKIKVSNNLEKIKNEPSIQPVLLHMQSAILNALNDLDSEPSIVDEDILHITRNNFEILHDYFSHLVVE